MWSGDYYHYGCVGDMSYNGTTDHDCVIAYGQDNGVQAVSGYSSTRYSAFDCPDSWRGDGYCDLCIVAKYGADARDGENGSDDCTWQSGVNKSCTDIFYDKCASTNFWGSCKGADVMTVYTATH
jgi:hypothetical protein